MEIRIELVAFSLFYYHALVYKEFVQVHENIAPTFKTDTCVTFFQGCDNIGIALYYILSKSVLQITKSTQDVDISEVKAMHIRDKDFEPFAFRINETALPEVVKDYVFEQP